MSWGQPKPANTGTRQLSFLEPPCELLDQPAPGLPVSPAWWCVTLTLGGEHALNFHTWRWQERLPRCACVSTR